MVVCFFFLTVEGLFSFPHVGGMLCIARGYKIRYLLHLISARIASWVSSMLGCVTVSPSTRSCSSVFLICQNNISPVQRVFHFSVCFFSFFTLPPASLFVGVGLALMSGLHCYLGRPPACSCGWNYLVYLARRPSSSSVSNRRRRRRRRTRPTHWTCLMWTDGQQTACHVCRKTRELS